MQITVQFAIAFEKVSRDPEVRDALAELEDVDIAQLFGDATDEHVAYRKIKAFVLREVRRRRARRRDLALQHFGRRDRELLGLHPKGREFLRRMAEGDRSVVEPAGALLVAIRNERAALGLE